MPKNPPDGWTTLSSAVFYDDAVAAIDWLEKALGFETRIRVDGDAGVVIHSELVVGDGVVMVASANRAPFKSPRSIGGANTQSLFLFVRDVDAAYTRAKKAGATIKSEPETKNYGDEYGSNRTFELEDPEGHRWWLGQRV